MARAARLGDGRYIADAPEPVDAPATLLSRLAHDAGSQGCCLVGFDFPIGLPAAYAVQIGCASFLDLLPDLGKGAWSAFYRPADHPTEISLFRPFYPNRPGGTAQHELANALGAGTFDALRRQCERAHQGRRAACPLFWTLGGQQVGKAAIAGWSDVLALALRLGSPPVVVWPFDGALVDLFLPGRVIVAETYPAEYYGTLGISFPPSRAGVRSGKTVQADRQANERFLSAWANRVGVDLSPRLADKLRDGFGGRADGEDQFDAVVGLFAMLNVVLGRQSAAPSLSVSARTVEGWILGQVQGARVSPDVTRRSGAPAS